MSWWVDCSKSRSQQGSFCFTRRQGGQQVYILPGRTATKSLILLQLAWEIPTFMLAEQQSLSRSPCARCSCRLVPAVQGKHPCDAVSSSQSRFHASHVPFANRHCTSLGGPGYPLFQSQCWYIMRSCLLTRLITRHGTNQLCLTRCCFP